MLLRMLTIAHAMNTRSPFRVRLEKKKNGPGDEATAEYKLHKYLTIMINYCINLAVLYYIHTGCVMIARTITQFMQVAACKCSFIAS